LVQCLVRRHAGEESHAVPGPEVLSENRFLAARDGMAAELLDERGARHPVRELVSERLAECAAVAQTLGCTAELAGAARLAGEPTWAVVARAERVPTREIATGSMRTTVGLGSA